MQVIIFKKYKTDFPFISIFIIITNNTYKSSDKQVPENLCTIRWLILVYKADLSVFKTYGYFVVMLYTLEGDSKR